MREGLQVIYICWYRCERISNGRATKGRGTLCEMLEVLATNCPFHVISLSELALMTAAREGQQRQTFLASGASHKASPFR